MLIDCSEISISVIAKDVQHNGIINAFCLFFLLSFPVPGETEWIAVLWFAWGDQYPGWHYDTASQLYDSNNFFINWVTLKERYKLQEETYSQ